MYTGRTVSSITVGMSLMADRSAGRFLTAVCDIVPALTSPSETFRRVLCLVLNPEVHTCAIVKPNADSSMTIKPNTHTCSRSRWRAGAPLSPRPAAVGWGKRRIPGQGPHLHLQVHSSRQCQMLMAAHITVPGMWNCKRRCKLRNTRHCDNLYAMQAPRSCATYTTKSERFTPRMR